MEDQEDSPPSSPLFEHGLGERRPAFKPAQEWLLPYENPLNRRLGKEFFSAIPRTPGVYTMLGPEASILYIGKAKDLRARLMSYRRAHPDVVSRKVIRLVHLL